MPDQEGSDSAVVLAQNSPEAAPSPEDSAATASAEGQSAPVALPPEVEARIATLEAEASRTKGFQARATRAEQKAAELERKNAEQQARLDAMEPFIKAQMTPEEEAEANARANKTRFTSAAEEQQAKENVARLGDIIEDLEEAGALAPDLDLRAEMKALRPKEALERLQELAPDLFKGVLETTGLEQSRIFEKNVRRAINKAREKGMTEKTTSELEGLKAKLVEFETRNTELAQQISRLEAGERAVPSVRGNGVTSGSDADFISDYAAGKSNDHKRARQLLGLK